MSGHGGTGRRVRLRGVWATIRVQVPVTAPRRRSKAICSDFFIQKIFALPLAPPFSSKHGFDEFLIRFLHFACLFYLFRDFKNNAI